MRFFIRDAETKEVLEGKLLEQFAIRNCPNLIYCDLEGFFLRQNGKLILADECGGWDYVDTEKVIIVFVAGSL